MLESPRFVLAIASALILTLSPLSVDADGTIEGTVTFWGDPGGGTQIEIAAMPDNFSGPAGWVFVGLNDTFSLPVPDGNYYVWAYMDREGVFGDADDEDVIVYYDANADGEWDMVPVSGGATTGIDIDIGFVYVDADATGANNGSSWTDAFTGLQDGIDLAVSGIEVWVAEGTYTPGPNRGDSFLPKRGVRVCGGFTGVETIRQQRDWTTHPTILSCEIGSAAATDNCYHVVRAEGSSPTALLDGVTITRGYADGGDIDGHGGGVRARGGGVTLANVTLIDNYATIGGGVMANQSGTVKAYNSSFINNRAPNFEGGAYYGSVASSQPQTLANCVFAGNSAWRGGGIALTSTGLQPVLVNLSLSGNTATGEGGGIYVNSPSMQYVIHNSIIWGNTGPNPQISAYAGVNWPEVNHSIVQGGWAAHTGTHVLDEDPSFADADLRINLDSPAIDAADNTAVVIDLHDADGNHWTDEQIHTDRDFNWRFRNLPYVPNTGVSAPGEWPVDIGAYEAWDPTLIFEHDFEGGGLDPWTAVVWGT